MDCKPPDHLYRSYTCCQCGYSFSAPLYCGNRFCTECGHTRRSRIKKKLRGIISSLTYERGYNTKHLTLTIPNQKDIRYASKILQKSFRKLRQRQLWQNKVKGGAWVLEVTGRPGRWHVHAHCVLEAKYIPHNRLRRAWSKVSPGRIVYIKPIPPSRAVYYLTKYLGKSEVEEKYHREVSDALKGVRLFQPFGSWHGICSTIEIPRVPCPDCSYPGFYWNPEEVPWERYGRGPPEWSLAAGIKRKVILKYGVAVHPITEEVFT